MLPKWIDAEMPFRGPCEVCGGPDARHRVTDAIWEYVNAGEWIEDAAAEYGVSEQFVARLAGLTRPPWPGKRLEVRE